MGARIAGAPGSAGCHDGRRDRGHQQHIVGTGAWGRIYQLGMI